MRPLPLIVCIGSLLLAAWIVVRMAEGTSQVAVSSVDVRAQLPEVAVGLLPSVSFDATSHDFGEMYAGESGTHVFHVTNKGEGPLELKVVGSSCSCTVGDLESSSVPPGGSTEVKLDWTIKTPKPRFEHSAQIGTNDPAKQVHNLIVRGRVISGLLTAPRDAWSFGVIPYKDSGTIEGFVLSDARADLEIIALESSLPEVTAEVTKLTADALTKAEHEHYGDAIEPGKRANNTTFEAEYLRSGYQIKLTAKPVGGRQDITGKLTLQTNLKDRPTFDIPFSGMYTGPLQFVPMPGTRYFSDQGLITLKQFDAVKGQTAELLMLVRGMDAEMEVSDITTEPPWLKVAVTPAASSTKSLRFRIKIEVPAGLPSLTRGRSNPAVIRMKTNHPSVEELKLDFAFSSI